MNKRGNNRGQVALSMFVVLVIIALILIIIDNRQSNNSISGQNIYGTKEVTCDYNLDSCKNTGWESNKVYCLNQSIISNSNCFNIDNSSVTLDCKGYNLTGGGDFSGILILKNNSIVRNCLIFSTSVAYIPISLQANNSLITNNTFGEGGANVISLTNSRDSVISNNKIYGNADSNAAISLTVGSNNNTIFNNTLLNGYDGIRISSSLNNTIYRNNITNNDIGIRFSGTIETTKNNLIYDNYFNNTQNIDSFIGVVNYWNTTYSCSSGSKQNILGGDCIGGNYWDDYNGVDNGNGISPYNVTPWNKSADGFGDINIPYNDSGRITTGGDYHPLLSGVTASSAPDTHTTSDFWTDTTTLSSSQFHDGYSLKLNATQRVRVSVDGDNHYIGIISITNTTVVINVSSVTQQANLTIGQSKQFDVNNDSSKDINITLRGISNYTLTNYTANFTIKFIENETVLVPVLYCGDGKVSTGEQCDGTNLSGSTCASVLGTGYTGTLSCTLNCTRNTTQCSAPVILATTTNNTSTTIITSTPEEESNAILWIIIIVSVFLIIALVIFFILRRNNSGSGQSSQSAQSSPFISRRPPSFPTSSFPNRIPQLPPRPVIQQSSRIPIVQQPRPVMPRQIIQPRPIMLPPGTKIPQMQQSQPRQIPPQSQQSSQNESDLPPSPPR